MNITERHDKIINTIENHVQFGTDEALTIAKNVAKDNGCTARVLSDVFNYLFGYPLISYIRSRKLVAAYNLLANGKGNIDRAIEVAGYADQTSFTKAFKKQFGVTPGDVLKGKATVDTLPSPLYWACLSDIHTPQPVSYYEKEEDEMLIFGLSENTYKEVVKAIELESLYGFSLMFSNYAFNLSKKTHRTMEDCFRYVDSLRDYGGDFIEGYDDDLTPEERLRELGDNELYQEVFFTRGISIELIDELVITFKATKEQLLKCEERMLRQFPGFENPRNISFSYYIKAYEYYTEHFDIDSELDFWAESEEGFFYDYITEIMAGVPIETAFAEISENISVAEALEEMDPESIDPQQEYEEMMRNYYIDRLASEEASWHGRRIDDDLYFDSDNDVYNQYDREEDLW